MHPDKWPEIKTKILSGFEVLAQGETACEERLENTEYLEFNGPLGKMRLEWISRPKVLGKKTHYSTRIGSNVDVDYIYSEDEATHTLKIYKWDSSSNDWQEQNAKTLGL